MQTETTAPTGTGDATAAADTTATQTTATTETTAATSASDTTTETKAADATKDATLLDGGASDKTVTAPADWPSDWREKLAGEDKKTLERLGRMGSPADLLKSYRALEQRLSSGEVKKALPENATPEQVAEWRKENGIPEKPEAYEIKLPDGLVIGEADKPIVSEFTKFAHEKNWDGTKLNEALTWYYAEQDRQRAARDEADAEIRRTSEDALRAEWGPEYRPNVNAVKNLLAGLPEGEVDKLLGGRLADGTKIGDSPAVIKWLSQLSRDLNPAATLVPAGTDIGKGVESRLAELKVLIKDRQSEYYKGPNANKLQSEYRELVDAQAKMKSRAA